MKRISHALTFLLLSFSLVGCTSNDEKIEYSSIEEARDLKVGEEVAVEGIVIKHHYDGQETPVIVGFWLGDESGSIYVYDREKSPNVEVGNKIKIKEVKDYYIPKTDEGSAPKIGYKGMNQIKDIEIIENDKQTHEIPEVLIHDSSIKEILDIPLSVDITGQIYHLDAHYIVSPSGDHTNYIIEDPYRINSLLAYTTCNGKDFAWSDEYNDKTYEMLVIVSVGKPRDLAWRFEPYKFIKEVVISDSDEAKYALDRASLKFNKAYMVDSIVSINKIDEKVEGITLSAETEGDIVKISENETELLISISVETIGKQDLKLIAKYKEAIESKTIVIETIKKPVIENVKTLKEARALEDGNEVTVEGIVARVTYKSGMQKQGLFLIDETSSLFCYNETDKQVNIEEVENFNKVIVKGIITHFKGTLELKNVEVLFLDTTIYEIKDLPSIIKGKTVADIVNTELDDENITSNIYELTGIVYENTEHGHSYGMKDIEDNSISIGFYSQCNGNDYEDFNFTSYVDKEITLIIGVQNISGTRWRCCPMLIL